MTNAEIGQMLATSGLPVFYDHAKKGTTLPYITYRTESDNFFADNKTYQDVKSIRAVLYTNIKSPTLEATIEGIFDSNNIPWNRDEGYNTEMEVFMEIYESEVI